MVKCHYEEQIERWLDGERVDAAFCERHVTTCPTCAARAAQLKLVRAGVGAVATHEEIRDAQFPAFLNGIRERLETPARHHYGLWALSSVSLAALIAAFSAFLLMTGGPRPASAVESATTELEDTEVTVYESENGTPTVWIHKAEEDLW
ncbi:MAG: hypothetical protein HY706_15260 [Candidatus Hydrogenedentes bacterium]|nr:hypothetical protein [Candidatus Hydrogenedentota bacterium]